MFFKKCCGLYTTCEKIAYSATVATSTVVGAGAGYFLAGIFCNPEEFVIGEFMRTFDDFASCAHKTIALSIQLGLPILGLATSSLLTFGMAEFVRWYNNHSVALNNESAEVAEHVELISPLKL